jgi:hypothetical protein
MTMNRGNMAKQVTEAPMDGCKSKRMKKGGSVKSGYKKGGMVKKKGYAKGGSVDQTMCSPRKRMAMGK